MSKESTALVMVGANGIGPFGGEGWRVGFTAQLVEGGSRGPFWLAAPSNFSDASQGPDVLIIDSLDPHVVADSLVLLLASLLADEQLHASLEQSKLVGVRDGVRTIAQPWVLNDAVRSELVEWLKPRCRLGLVNLSQPCSLNDEALSLLRSWGFTVDVYDPRVH